MIFEPPYGEAIVVVMPEESPPQYERLDLKVREYGAPEQGLYIAMTSDAHELALGAGKGAHQVGRSAIRPFLEASIAEALRDPHGPSSIDQFAETDAGRTARVVCRVSQEGESVAGMPIALKGTGLDSEFASTRLGHRVDLLTQFHFMHRLFEAQRQLHPEGIWGKVFINQPFAYMRHKKGDGQVQEWLIMERVTDAVAVVEHDVVLTMGGTAFGFDRGDYPDLAARADPFGYEQSSVLFSDLGKAITQELRPHVYADLKDVVGHNILAQGDGAERRYVLIDIQPGDLDLEHNIPPSSALMERCAQ